MSSQCPASYDPYDLWMTPLGVYAKRKFYQGKLLGKLLSVAVAVFDWLLPTLSRKLCGAKKREYPITVAQWILSQSDLVDGRAALQQLMATASNQVEAYGCAWGLGFPWMSKNGLYDQNMPFITHTPYALEALLKIIAESRDEEVKQEAQQYFFASLKFLDSLKIMWQDENSLALSYAPIDEPRIVVNANSYAAFCYALHSVHGTGDAKAYAKRSEKLVSWVLAQQQDNGCWYYYADNEAGNFIDGFHSCFVLKNLIKTAKLLPQLQGAIDDAVAKGVAYLEDHFIDSECGLLHRFTERDIKDPFVWDLYDQAEYLGLLVLQGKIIEGEQFLQLVTERFQKKGNWYCRTDFLKRRWGKNFFRWGIMPLLHQQHELAQLKAVN